MSERAAPLLEIAGLTIAARVGSSAVTLVDDVGLEVAAGETVGLVGESGSGKSLTALSILGLLPRNVGIVDGSVRLAGEQLVGASRAVLQQVRGRRAGIIFQDAMRSLNPAMSVGDQIAEVVRQHLGGSRAAARARAVEALRSVGIDEPERRAGDYPHQFSGGMAQRVMIAMALVCEPQLLIADEPTTALDVTVQREVLLLLRSMQERLGLGVLLITHDLGVVAQVCDRMNVMYAGQVVEHGAVDDVFDRPRHPYTEALLGAIPNVLRADEPFTTIPGTVPLPGRWPAGCRFVQRCAHAGDGCRGEAVPLTAPLTAAGGATVRCRRADELALEGVHRVAP